MRAKRNRGKRSADLKAHEKSKTTPNRNLATTGWSDLWVVAASISPVLSSRILRDSYLLTIKYLLTNSYESNLQQKKGHPKQFSRKNLHTVFCTCRVLTGLVRKIIISYSECLSIILFIVLLDTKTKSYLWSHHFWSDTDETKRKNAIRDFRKLRKFEMIIMKKNNAFKKKKK